METVIGVVTFILSLFYQNNPTEVEPRVYMSENSITVTVVHDANCYRVKGTQEGNSYCCCIQTDETDYIVKP